MPDPSTDTLFGDGAASPTARGGYGAPVDPTSDQLFGPAAAAPTPTGAATNAWWSDPLNSLGRIVKNAGYGLNEPWDGRNVGLDDQSSSALQRAGVLPDYNAGNENFLNSAAEAIIRPAADAADLLWNAPGALAGGFAAGARQVSAELGGRPPEGAILPGGSQAEAAARARGIAASALSGGAITPQSLEAAAELASGITKGYYPELAEEGAVGGEVTNAAARAARASDAATARAVGALGEGEAGFYDAHPLTPEAATARTSAASEAGIEPPEPLPPPPDVHSLARRIDPETFQEYDALNAESALHRATIASLGAERAASPEALEAQAQIDTIMGRVNNVPSRLTNAARGRLEAAQGRLDDILTTDTPEMAEARGRLLDADYAMRDLAVDVSAAYRHAREIAPDLPETAPEEQPVGAPKAEEEGAPEPAAEMAAVSEREATEPAAEARARETAAVGATAEAQAEVAPSNVVGERLGEVGEAATASGRAATGFNGLLDRQGNPIRFKNDQEWAPGNKVNVGFVKGLTVEGTQAATAEHDAAFIVTSDKGQVYAFTPQKGLARLEGADAEAALAEARGKPAVIAEPAEAGAALARQEAREAEGVTEQRPGITSETHVEGSPEAQQLFADRLAASREGGAPGAVRTEAVEGRGETVTRGLAKHTEEDAIARGLTNSFGDLPEYERVSMADQARQASDLIDSDPELARDIAMGRKAAPSGLLPESVYVAVEKRATAAGDVETLRQLATDSKLATAATTMGQRIRTLGERDRTSPVGAIAAVQQAREAAFERSGIKLEAAKAVTVSDIKVELRKAASKADAWQSFLEQIQCSE